MNHLLEYEDFLNESSIGPNGTKKTLKFILDKIQNFSQLDKPFFVKVESEGKDYYFRIFKYLRGGDFSFQYYEDMLTGYLDLRFSDGEKNIGKFINLVETRFKKFKSPKFIVYENDEQPIPDKLENFKEEYKESNYKNSFSYKGYKYSFSETNTGRTKYDDFRKENAEVYNYTLTRNGKTEDTGTYMNAGYSTSKDMFLNILKNSLK